MLRTRKMFFSAVSCCYICEMARSVLVHFTPSLAVIAIARAEQTTCRRHQYRADFKLKAIALALVKGNRGAGAELSVNEKLIRYWRKQEGELSTCKAGQKSFRGPKCQWPDLENELEEWVGIQRAGGRGVSTTQLRIKPSFSQTQRNPISPGSIPLNWTEFWGATYKRGATFFRIFHKFFLNFVGATYITVRLIGRFLR